jgi:hypothetical protein
MQQHAMQGHEVSANFSPPAPALPYASLRSPQGLTNSARL